MRVWDEIFGCGITDRAEGVETFGDGPRKAFFLGFVLQVAGRKVDGEGIDCTLINTDKRRQPLNPTGAAKVDASQSMASIAPLSSFSSKSLTSLPIISASSTS